MTKQIANFFKSCLKAVFLTVCFFTLLFPPQIQNKAIAPLLVPVFWAGGLLLKTAVATTVVGGGAIIAERNINDKNVFTGQKNDKETVAADGTKTVVKTAENGGTSTTVTTKDGKSTTTTQPSPKGEQPNFPSIPTDAKDLKFSTAKDTAGGGFSDCPNLDQIRASGAAANGLLEKCGRQLITFAAVFAIFGLVLRISLIGFAMFAPGGKDETAKIKGLISDVVIGILLLGGFGMFVTIINPGVFGTSGFAGIVKFAGQTPSGAGATGGAGNAGTGAVGGAGTAPTNTPVAYKGNGSYTKPTLENAVAVAKDPAIKPEEKAKAIEEVKNFVSIKQECEKAIIPLEAKNLCETVVGTEKSLLDLILSLGDIGVPNTDQDPIIANGNVGFNMRNLKIITARTRENFSTNTSTDPNILPKQNWELGVEFESKIAGEYIKSAKIYLKDCENTLLGGNGIVGQLDTADVSVNGVPTKARYYNPRVMIGKTFGPEAMDGLTNSLSCVVSAENASTTGIKVSEWVK